MACKRGATRAGSVDPWILLWIASPLFEVPLSDRRRLRLRRRLREAEATTVETVLAASAHAAQAIRDGLALAGAHRDAGRKEEAWRVLQRLAHTYRDERAVLVVALHMARLQARPQDRGLQDQLALLAGSEEPIAPAARFARVWLDTRAAPLAKKRGAYVELAGDYPCCSIWQAWTWLQIGKECLLQERIMEARQWYRKAQRAGPRFSPPWCKAFRALREV